MLRVAIVHTGGAYQERVREYLESRPGAQVKAYQVPDNLPLIMDEEEAEALIPAEVAEADVVIAISLHQNLLNELPYVMGKGNGKALIAPREEPQWIRPGLMNQVTKSCGKFGIENAFPKPFCAFRPTTPVLRQFAEEYQAGHHDLDVECEDGVVVRAVCRRSSPCGLTEWAAEELVGWPCDGTLPRRLVELLHLRPCLSSMALDEETGDTIMHKAIHLIEESGQEALQKAEVAGK